MIVASERSPDQVEVVALYDAVGWTAYTNDPDALLRALAQSHVVLTARDGNGTLLGLARTVSDDVSVCFVQDLLVHPDHQRRGVGRELLQRLLRRYAHCRTFALMTDADDTTPRAFYRAFGLTAFVDQGLVGYRRPG